MVVLAVEMFDDLMNEIREKEAKGDDLANNEVSAWVDKLEGIAAPFVDELDAGDDLLEQVKASAAALLDWAAAKALEPSAPKRKRGRPKRNLPAVIPQQTSPEIVAMGTAVTDALTLAFWGMADERGAELVHQRPQTQHYVRFAPLVMPELWGGGPINPGGDLVEVLVTSGGVDTLLVSQVGCYLALKKHEVTIKLDDLMSLVGMEPRTAKQREAMRLELWIRLSFIDNLTVHGLRKGTYKNPDSGETLDMNSDDSVLKITGKRGPEQQSFDRDPVPLEVTFVAGPSLSMLRRDPRALFFFGDILPIAAIGRSHTPGAWARALGCSLNQRWREGATAPERTFTRRKLLGLFPPYPTPESIFESGRPDRARKYWTQAIRLLKAQGVVGMYKEHGQAPEDRQGWWEQWLDEKLTIRPGAAWQSNIVEIAAAKAELDAKAERRRSRRGA
jgi:hypothetical protein